VEIAEYVKSSVMLTSLSMGTNCISPAGATALADSLQTNPVLTFLDLSSNFIGPPLGFAMAEALKVNRVLTSLDLSMNKLDATAGKALAAALKINVGLTSLNLAGNPYDRSSGIGSEAAKAIAGAVASSSGKSLKKLNLSDNKLDQAAKTMVKRVTADRDGLELHLDSVEFVRHNDVTTPSNIRLSENLGSMAWDD